MMLTNRIKITSRCTGSPINPAPGDPRVVEDASRLDNAADEEYPLIARRKAPHNQRIEQTPFGLSSSAALGQKRKIN
jgi:hypothetical protein